MVMIRVSVVGFRIKVSIDQVEDTICKIEAMNNGEKRRKKKEGIRKG